MIKLFAAEVPVHYGFLFLSDNDDQPELMDTRAGQRNGLCGAAVRGVLSMVTGLHTGRVPLIVEWHDAEPPLGPEWEEAVEVPFRPRRRRLALTSFDDAFDVRLPAKGDLRARFCAVGMDAAHAQDTTLDDEPTVDRYLLALWPAEPAPDAVLRQTGEHAAYWHREARAVRVPTKKERAAEAKKRRKAEKKEEARATAAAEKQLWGGRRPTRRLRKLGGNVLGVARSHRDLLDAFAALDAGAQRDVACWLARRAFEIAGLADRDWVRPALAALDRGAPLPPPFTRKKAVFPLVQDDLAAEGGTLAVGVWRAAGTPRAWPVHRPSFAVPAIFSATHPDPLRALVDTFSHAEATFGDRAAELLAELRDRLPAGREIPDPESTIGGREPS
jgi:hypothetical protein